VDIPKLIAKDARILAQRFLIEVPFSLMQNNSSCRRYWQTKHARPEMTLNGGIARCPGIIPGAVHAAYFGYRFSWAADGEPLPENDGIS
jgi:hypothetical protein